jgi:hypothetical protein
MKRLVDRPFAPAALTLLLASGLVFIVLLNFHGDALALARLGTRFSSGDQDGTAGYDGQFVYYIARSPDPSQIIRYLDVPAYRYQRILLPVLSRILVLGNVQLIPWVLIMLGILSQAVGTWAVGELMHGWGVSRWYALIYGLWVGFLLALIVDLPEPLAYALVALGWLARTKEKKVLSALLFSLALFAKEVTMLFVAAAWIFDLSRRNWSSFWLIFLAVILPYGFFQFWLYHTFGQFGIASGGEMATSFEWIPFMGLWRIGSASWKYLLAMLVVFAPAVLLPVTWGIWSASRRILGGNYEDLSLALLFNCLAIVFLPFSTFRETGGLLRFACGLVLAVLLFASRHKLKQVLNYCWLWLVLNVFLLKP